MDDFTDSDYAKYLLFCSQRKKDLQRIANHTNGAHDLEDVSSQALIMAHFMRREKNTDIDWLRPEHQDLLLSYLYQDLVKYTERHVIFVTRLDHWSGDGMDDEPHPLLKKLVADDGADPESILSARQETLLKPQPEPDCHQSLAGAYLHLLRRFDNKMIAVADHLLISRSYCYACFARVRRFAEQQHPLPIKPTAKSKNFIPGAWRRFRLRRAPVQLAFDFDIEQPLYPRLSEPAPMLAGNENHE